MNTAIKLSRLTGTVEQCSLATHVAPATWKLSAPIRISFGGSLPNNLLPNRFTVSMGSREMSLHLCDECKQTLFDLLSGKELSQ